MSNYELRPSRKLVNSSFIWKRLDNSYSCLGGASLMDGLIHYCQQKEITAEVFGRSISRDVDEYLKRRKIELSNNIVEDHCKTYLDMFKGTMLVESRSKHDVIRHKLRISDLVSKDSTDERKDASLKSMNILCDCLGAHYQTFLTVSREVREAFGDNRSSDNIPSPHVSMPIDTHGVMGMNFLVEQRKAEDFGIFGLNQHTTEIARHVIKSALDKNIPEYDLNLFLRDKTVLFNPLRERIS
jgi:hypothetical protein